MAQELEIVNPYTTNWATWSADFVEQLSRYNPPNPGQEDSWAMWAASVCSIPALAELGLQSPETFRSWRDWAAALYEAI